MSTNSKKEYYKSGRGASELSILPAFMDKSTNGILFSLHNPQSIILDDIYRDINTSFLNLNPMSLSLALPSEVHYADDLVAGAVPTGDVALEEVTLYNFHNNLPTRIGATGATGVEISGGTGFLYKDFHYISPTYYNEGTDIHNITEGYVGLREGSWLTDDLITVFDGEFNKINSYTMPYIKQNIEASEDEWVEIDENNIHTLKHPYVVKDSVQVINPIDTVGGAPQTYTGWTMTNGNQILFTTQPDFNLVVEYNYVPSPLLNSIFYFNKQHNTETTTSSSEQLPTGFSYLVTEMHDTNSIEEGATYAHQASVSRNINFKKLVDNENNIRLETKANELATGQTATIGIDYYATYSYDLLNDTGSYWSGGTHTIVLNDNLDAPFEIFGDKISILDNSGLDITSKFEHSATGGIDYLYITSSIPSGANVHIPYKKTISLDRVSDVFSESITDIFTIGDVTSSMRYYLKEPYSSGGTSDYISDITLPASYGRGFTFDGLSAGLSTGATFSVEYFGMNKTSFKHGKEWFTNMVLVDYADIVTSPTGDNTGTNFLATDTFNAYEITMTTDTSIHDSLVQGPSNIHIVDNHFTKPVYSLNKVEGRVEIYNNLAEIQDFYNLFWTEHSIDSIAGSYPIYSSNSTSSMDPKCIRYFQESIAILFEISSSVFNLRFYDLNTLSLLEDVGNFNVPGASNVNSFSFDKEHNLILFSDTYSYEVKLYFDYFTRIVNEDETEDLYFRENDYTTFSISDSSGTTAINSVSDLISYPVEHSIDHWGRVLGSDRWPNESLKEYLIRLTNITGASGNTTHQRALNGISATLNTETYTVDSLDHFYLETPVAINTEQFNLTGSTGDFVLEYPSSSIIHIDIYNNSLLLPNVTWSLQGATLTIDGGTSGASGATATVRYKTEATVTINGGTTSNYSLLYEDTTNDTPGLLHIGATGLTGEYSIEIDYYGKLDSKVYDPELDKETDIHKLNETFTGHREVGASSDQITIYDLLNSSYIEDNSSNNIPNTTALNIIKSGSTLKFKWGDFEWDKYSWSDGESIKLGLKTIFDAQTAISNFTSGSAVGDHLKFMGFNDDKKAQIKCGAFYYNDSTLYLGSNISAYLFGATSSYQDLSYLTEAGVTTDIGLSYTETPIEVKGNTGESLYVAVGNQTINNIQSEYENLGSATGLNWIGGGFEVGVTFAPEITGQFDVFVRAGASGQYTQRIDGVTYSSNKLKFSNANKVWLNTLDNSYDVIYSYNSYRYLTSSETDLVLGAPGPYGGAMKQDGRFAHSIDTSNVSTVFPDVNTVLNEIEEVNDMCFSINETDDTIKITDSTSSASDAHVMYKDSQKGDVYIINNLTFNNEKNNIGNKLLVFGKETSEVDSHSINVSSTIIDDSSYTLQFAIEILDYEFSGIKGNNIVLGVTGADVYLSNNSSISGEDGLALISTELRGPTGDISIEVKENNNLLETIIINNLGAV